MGDFFLSSFLSPSVDGNGKAERGREKEEREFWKREEEVIAERGGKEGGKGLMAVVCRTDVRSSSLRTGEHHFTSPPATLLPLCHSPCCKTLGSVKGGKEGGGTFGSVSPTNPAPFYHCLLIPPFVRAGSRVSHRRKKVKEPKTSVSVVRPSTAWESLPDNGQRAAGREEKCAFDGREANPRTSEGGFLLVPLLRNCD